MDLQGSYHRLPDLQGSARSCGRKLGLQGLTRAHRRKAGRQGLAQRYVLKAGLQGLSRAHGLKAGLQGLSRAHRLKAGRQGLTRAHRLNAFAPTCHKPLSMTCRPWGLSFSIPLMWLGLTSMFKTCPANCAQPSGFSVGLTFIARHSRQMCSRSPNEQQVPSAACRSQVHQPAYALQALLSCRPLEAGLRNAATEARKVASSCARQGACFQGHWREQYTCRCRLLPGCMLRQLTPVGFLLATVSLLRDTASQLRASSRASAWMSSLSAKSIPTSGPLHRYPRCTLCPKSTQQIRECDQSQSRP